MKEAHNSSQRPQGSVRTEPSSDAHGGDGDTRTSVLATLLKVVHALPKVTLAQLLAHEPPHHGLDPLLSKNGVLGLLQPLGVVVVDAVECRGNCWLSRQEHLGLGRRHFDW